MRLVDKKPYNSINACSAQSVHVFIIIIIIYMFRWPDNGRLFIMDFWGPVMTFFLETAEINDPEIRTAYLGRYYI